MKISEVIESVKGIAKRCGYEGGLSAESLRECADVYLDNCNEQGEIRPRLYMRSGVSHHATNLNEIQWLLSRTPSFRRWFGNSVVVDENGDPQVMYHGSWENFKEFKPSAIKREKVAMTLWSGPGFYFSDNADAAKIYAGGERDRVYEVFLRLENPLVVDETGEAADGKGITREQAARVFLSGDNTQWLDSGLAAELARMDESEGVSRGGKHHYKQMTREERVDEFVRRLKTDVVMLKTAALAFGARSQRKMLSAICRETGHDGVIHTIAPGVREWVVYNPNAVKSANENDGSYSSASEEVTDGQDGGASLFSRHNSTEKGHSDMNGIKSVLDALTKLVNPVGGKHTGMDIVDHLGRHHQPKAIPEGGQYESEGGYAASAKAKEEWFHKTFAENKKPEMKKMRDFCSDILSHVDSSKRGNDTMVSDYKKQIHKYSNMPKSSVLKGMKSAWDDMKTHADTYNEIKGMGKEEFAGWLKNHPEYNSTQMQNLMENKAYAKTYKIKNEKGEYEDQDHAAWEEAKMMIGRRAVASMVDYMAHTEALHNTPDAVIDSFLKGKGAAGAHKLGFEDYEKSHGIQHGEGEHAANVTMSEINAVESEMSKAIEDAKSDKSKTAYFHALSHFLGKDGGLRDPNATKESVIEKAAKRLVEKENAVNDAAASGNKDLYAAAAADFDATQNALKVLEKVLGVDKDLAENKIFKIKHPDYPEDVGKNVPAENITKKPDEPKQIASNANPPEAGAGEEDKPKKSLSEAGKKLMDGIGSFLDSEMGKKYQAMTDKVLNAETKGMLDKTYGDSDIGFQLQEANKFKDDSSKLLKGGDKQKARESFAKYIHIIGLVHKQLKELA